MKTSLILLFCLTGQGAFSQIKIKLASPRIMQEEYNPVNASDTMYIETGHNEDMGVWNGHYYILKSGIPDGQYEIFVDDTLELSAFIKKNQYDSLWTYYYSNGKPRSILSYKDGKLNGEMIEYYEDGSIRFKGTFLNDKANGITTSFYKSGKIQAKYYYENGEYIKQEVFDRKGKMKSVYYPSK